MRLGAYDFGGSASHAPVPMDEVESSMACNFVY